MCTLYNQQWMKTSVDFYIHVTKQVYIIEPAMIENYQEK